MLVTEKMVQAAFDWLQENAGPAAKAKAEKIKAEHATKKTRAMMFLEAEGNNAEREASAISSQEVQDAIDAEAEAVRQDEWFRNQRGRAEALIEAWRTESSNIRAMGKVA